MPLPMIHLSVAINIERKMKLEKSPLFFLGSISPDAIHMRSGAGRDDKQKTHCIGETRDKTLDNVREMLRHAKSLNEGDLRTFILGYCAHILTDVVWADTVWKDYLNKLAQTDLQVNPKVLYYRETDYIDFKIFRESPWRENIWNKLSMTKSPDYMDLLTSEEIEKWKIRTLEWFEDEDKDPKIPPQFIKEAIIEKFISEATDLVYEEILTYGIQQL